MAEVGTPAPDFNLYKSKSDRVELKSLRGRNVVLSFFPAAFTGVCTNQVCSFRDALANFNDMSADVLGICVDGPFTLAEFSKQNDLTFPLLSDLQKTTIRDYDVYDGGFAHVEGYEAAKRSVFVIDAEGTIRYRWVAPNPGVEPDYEAVRAAVAAL